MLLDPSVEAGDPIQVGPIDSRHLPLEHDRALLPERLVSVVDANGSVLDLVANRLGVLVGRPLRQLLHGNRAAKNKPNMHGSSLNHTQGAK